MTRDITHNCRNSKKYSQMKICIIGFMTSGKSKVGKLVAEQLGLEFIDLDQYIAKHESTTIDEIFEKQGEKVFRVLERKYLEEVLALEGDYVLALGGGTPCFFDNMDLINKYESVYLRASKRLLNRRLATKKDTRPLVKEKKTKELKRYVKKSLDKRHRFYRQAKHTVKTSDVDAAEIVENVITLFKK